MSTESNVVPAPPRPTISKEIVMEAAEKIAKQIENGNAEHIADCYRPYMDGYKLAKALDIKYSWDCCLDDAEKLDNMGFLISRSLEEAEKKWAEENNIQPPLPIGTMINKGVIVGIYEYSSARYLVKENGCDEDGRHLVIKFEDAIAAQDQSNEH